MVATAYGFAVSCLGFCLVISVDPENSRQLLLQSQAATQLKLHLRVDLLLPQQCCINGCNCNSIVETEILDENTSILVLVCIRC